MNFTHENVLYAAFESYFKCNFYQDAFQIKTSG